MDINGYRMKFGSNALTLAATSVVIEGLRAIKENPPVNKTGEEIRAIVESLQEENWNQIRSLIKRCL